MEINSISDFRKAIRNGKYSFPGGYPKYFIMSDGEALSWEAAKECRRQILHALSGPGFHNGWRVVAVEINWEDTNLLCSHTYKLIESAYG